MASVPLLHTGQVLGAMDLVARQPRAFPPEELEMLTAIGQQIGVAVENARLYEQAQQELGERTRAEEQLLQVSEERARRNRELVLLNRVIAATTSRLEPDAVLEAVCRELALAFDVPEVGAALLDKGGETLTVVAEYRTEDRPSALGAVLPVEGYHSAEYVLQRIAPLAVADAQNDPRMAPVHGLMRERGTASLLILPLTVRGEAVGTLALVAVEKREFTSEEIALAANAAAAASQALETARAEQALRDSQQRLSLHVQYTPLAYIEWDADLRVIDWNPSAEKIFGYSEDEAKGHHAYEIIVPPEVQSHVTEVWQSLLTQSGGTRSTNENFTKDGRKIICEWYNTPLIDENGQVIGLASLVQDITERVEAEEALRDAKVAAETANQAKSIFLANMSHELRTPLNAILGFAQIMGRDPQATPEQRESVEIIGRSGEHLLGLINDVLEMSKIEAGRVTLQEQPFDLYRMLDGLEEMFQLRATEKGLVLAFDRAPDVPQFVRGDDGKLRQVLMNLLGNGIKFTKKGGVKLRVRRSPPSPVAEYDETDTRLRLRFEVQDTGPGIAPEEMSAVFDPFVQTATGQQSHEGTGLGLPISRRFVRLMGGDFVVTSEVDRGSAFCFDVPIELANATDVPVAHPERRVIGLEPDQPVYRLLIAEDQETNRRLLVNLLTKLGSATSVGGFEVREAVNGQEAVEIWEQWEPHLIWMDLRMPVMNGYQAVEQIRSVEQSRVRETTKGQATVIVALTASAFENDKAQILSEGCDDFVRKPFREEEIFDLLAKHLGVRFVYEDIESGDGDKGREDALALARQLAPDDLAGLPANWLARLRQAAVRLDTDAVLELADRIDELDPTLADALARLVREFRFDTIVALTESLEDEHD
jgi:two-component system sensor histidine kinase/response regulator